jgi:hypothetical protein
LPGGEQRHRLSYYDPEHHQGDQRYLYNGSAISALYYRNLGDHDVGFSSDHRMAGVQMGNDLVLFGADAPLIPFTGMLTYTVTGSSPVIHLLTDLPANRTSRFQLAAFSLGPSPPPHREL